MRRVFSIIPTEVLPAVAVIVFILSARHGLAFDWPVDKVTITATFCESRGDHFHSGVDLGGGEQKITSISEGELVFAYEIGRDYSSVPVGLGSFCVLQHKGGIRSVYCHFKENSLERNQVIFNSNDTLGIIGSTGYSHGKHLHLSIIDSEMDTVINPLLVLPPLKDTQPPVIKQLYLGSDNDLVEIKSDQIVTQGDVEILAGLYDLREDVSFIWKIAPYQISLYQDGKEVSSIVFDSIHEKNARLAQSEKTSVQGAVESPGGPEHDSSSIKSLSGDYQPPGGSQVVLANSDESFRDIYELDWLYRLGALKLVPGETSLLIFVRDFAGNESSTEFVLRVSE